ncbi:MAG: hypothetical protein ACOCZ6_00560 [Nanoarchaeota archaeon]
MKKAFLLILMFISFPLVFGAEFDEWVSHNDTIEVAKTNFSAQTTEDLLILKEVNGSSRLVIPVNETELYNEYFFENKGVKNSLQDYLDKHGIDSVQGSSEETNTYMHKLEVSKIESYLDVNRKAEKTPYVFEEVQIDYDIKNTGDERLNGIDYIEEIPSFLKPLEFVLPEEDDREMDFGRDKIDWTLNLKPGESEKLRGVFRVVGIPKEGQSFKLKDAEVTYDSPAGTISKTIEEENFVVRHPLTINAESSLDMPYAEEQEFIFNLKNKHPSRNVDIKNARLSFCRHVDVQEIPDGTTKFQDAYLLDKGTLGAEEEKPFEFAIELTAFKPCPAVFDVVYSINGVEFEKQHAINLSNEVKEPEMELSYKTLNGSTIRGGDNFFIEFLAENTNEYFVDEAVIEINSDFFDKRKFVFRGFSGKVGNNLTLTLPSFEEDTDEKMNMTVALVSKTGSTRVFEKTENVRIKEGMAQNIFEISGEVLNYSGSEYKTKMSVLQLSDANVDNLTVIASSGDYTKKINFTPQEVSQLNSAGDSVTKEMDFKFMDNATQRMVNFTIDAVVEENQITEDESFLLNGTSFFDEPEEEEKKEEVKKAAPAGEEVEEEKDEFKLPFSISTYVVIGMGILILISVGFVLFNKSSPSKDGGISTYGGMGSKKENKGSYGPSNLNVAFDKVTKQFDQLGEQESKPAAKSQAPKQGDDITKLEEYINNRLSAGDSKRKIRKELQKNGWLDDVLDLFLK